MQHTPFSTCIHQANPSSYEHLANNRLVRPHPKQGCRAARPQVYGIVQLSRVIRFSVDSFGDSATARHEPRAFSVARTKRRSPETLRLLGAFAFTATAPLKPSYGIRARSRRNNDRAVCPSETPHSRAIATFALRRTHDFHLAERRMIDPYASHRTQEVA